MAYPEGPYNVENHIKLPKTDYWNIRHPFSLLFGPLTYSKGGAKTLCQYDARNIAMPRAIR